MKKTAIIINSYNMVEWTDALVEHILETVKTPYDLYVHDNGSDLVEPSKYTNLFTEKNIQMVPGFLRALELVDETGIKYDYYWLITTSCRFTTTDKRDPLKLMLDVAENDPLTFLVHPALYIDYGAWKQIMYPMTDGPRRVFGIEGVCPFYRASMFNELGRWRKELTYGWGMGPEMDFLARKHGWHIYVLDSYVMEKQSEVGYHMDRMNMEASERRTRAAEERDEILIPIYGENYLERFLNENISPEEMSMFEAYHGKK
jgi:GT2 family glycosyltransferase